MLRKRLGADPAWRVASAGIIAVDGFPATGASVQVLGEIGIDAGGHRSQCITRRLVRDPLLVVGMTAGHVEELRRLYPAARERIRLMRSFSGGPIANDVVDPIGMSVDVYRETRDEIDAELPDLILYLKELAAESV